MSVGDKHEQISRIKSGSAPFWTMARTYPYSIPEISVLIVVALLIKRAPGSTPKASGGILHSLFVNMISGRTRRRAKQCSLWNVRQEQTLCHSYFFIFPKLASKPRYFARGTYLLRPKPCLKMLHNISIGLEAYAKKNMQRQHMWEQLDNATRLLCIHRCRRQ